VSSLLAFTSYGAFWMSYATMLIPGSGTIAAFGGNTKEFNNAVAIYLVAWLMFTFFVSWVLSTRATSHGLLMTFEYCYVQSRYSSFQRCHYFLVRDS
jgi:uncharacterized protein